MAQNNFPEPIEKKDGEAVKGSIEVPIEDSKETPEISKIEKGIPSEPAMEKTAENRPEEISEKIETVRKTIGAQQVQPVANVESDAQTVGQIQEFEKKVEKLVEIAVQKGPEHAIQVAQHMDKGKDASQADNYTLDEIHDKLMEDELRNQLIQKGLLKEL